MANLSANIRNFIAGDDLDVTRTISNIPASRTISQAWLTVKLTDTDLDAAAIFQKNITTTLSATQGIVSDSGADGTGVVEFYLQDTDTLLLTPDISYVYDVQIILDNGRVYTPEKGTMKAKRQITISSS